MKNLEKFGVQELDAVEVQSVKGGNPGIGAAFVIGAVFWILGDWDDFSQGFQDGYNGNEYNYDPCCCECN